MMKSGRKPVTSREDMRGKPVGVWELEPWTSRHGLRTPWQICLPAWAHKSVPLSCQHWINAPLSAPSTRRALLPLPQPRCKWVQASPKNRDTTKFRRRFHCCCQFSNAKWHKIVSASTKGSTENLSILCLLVFRELWKRWCRTASIPHPMLKISAGILLWKAKTKWVNSRADIRERLEAGTWSNQLKAWYTYNEMRIPKHEEIKSWFTTVHTSIL